jgi:hypothetical protein
VQQPRRRQQHLPPMPERRQIGRYRTERGQCIEHRFRFGGPAELQQRLRFLQMPVAGGAQIVGRRLGLAKQRQRVAGALVLQQIRRQVKPRTNVLRLADKRRAQQLFRRLRFAADAHERAEIGDCGSVAGGVTKRLTHRGLGFFDGALAVTGNAVIDPGICPQRRKPNGLRESALGLAGLAHGQPRLTIDIVCLRHVRCAVASLARRPQCSGSLAEMQK